MKDRRRVHRKPLDIFFNKFIEGYPFLCRSVDVSTTGILVETFSEPAAVAQRFPLELRLPGDEQTLWIWARAVRKSACQQALEFVTVSEAARSRLEQFIASA